MKKLKNLVDNQTLNFRKYGVAWKKIRVDKKAKKLSKLESNALLDFFNLPPKLFSVSTFLLLELFILNAKLISSFSAYSI